MRPRNIRTLQKRNVCQTTETDEVIILEKAEEDHQWRMSRRILAYNRAKGRLRKTQQASSEGKKPYVKAKVTDQECQQGHQQKNEAPACQKPAETHVVKKFEKSCHWQCRRGGSQRGPAMKDGKSMSRRILAYSGDKASPFTHYPLRWQETKKP